LELRCNDQDSIAVRFESASDEEQFFNLSYLRGDVRSFNASPDRARSPFLIEGCRLRGVDPFYHRIDLPYNRLPRWRGDVRFTFDGLTASLEGGRAQWLEIRHAVDGGDAAARSVRVSPEERGARVYAPLLQLRRPRSPEVMADLFHVGQNVVLAERIDPGRQDRILVNGFEVPPGRLLRLESGDWVELTLQAARGQTARFTYLVETGDRARTASFTRTRAEEVQRLFPAERLRPLLEPFSQAMDLALQSIPGGEDPESDVANAHVRLTLDRELSGQIEENLIAWCVRNRHPTRPRAVSAIVMDAFDGAVRAMPSCPGEDELAPFEPIVGRTRENLLRNQNLLPHPIGSAGKPFWAAAVATTYPNFLDLQIGAHSSGPTETALGCPLRAPYNDTHGSAAPVGLEQFIERSCNRYLVELATAALAVSSAPRGENCRDAIGIERVRDCFPGTAENNASTQLRFCDALIPVVLSTELEVVGPSCGDLKLVDSKFAPGPVFNAITNVVTYRDLSPRPAGTSAAPRLNERYRAERYRIDAWGRVLRELQAAGDTAHFIQTSLRFAAVSPQAANLALNTVEELRTDWVNLLLGGENSRWSNFELAEALARLMSGRDVTGEFVDSVGSGARIGELMDRDAALLSERQLHPGVRRRVLHAMELVTTTGTARSLSAPIDAVRERIAAIDTERPWDLLVFAKTGTPAVEKFLTSDQQRLVTRLFNAGDLRWDETIRRIELRAAAEQRLRANYGEATLRWLRSDVLRPMERDRAAFTAVGTELPEHPLYFDQRGRLRVRVLPDLRVSQHGGVLLLGFIAVPRATTDEAVRRGDWITACTIDPDLRNRILRVPPADLLDPATSVALSVAIFVDDLPLDQGSDQAVNLASDIIEPVAAYLEKQIRKTIARGGLPRAI
ncbi:MAG: hypothetical protein ACREMQ_03945, partial [Longimicrobiales bacterium]